MPTANSEPREPGSAPTSVATPQPKPKPEAQHSGKRNADTLVLYALELNRISQGDVTLLRSATGELMARADDLANWRLVLPDVTAKRFRGNIYYPLTAYSGIEIQIDEALQSISLTLPARYFASTQLNNGNISLAPPTPSKLGGFGNYDLLLNSSPSMKRLDGQFEVGLFNSLGVGVTSFLVKDMSQTSQTVRLESNWKRDQPDQMKTLVVGDTIGVSGLWGRPVRYAGLRYGTNYATRPGYVTFAQPQLSGEAALPTTAELFVDGVRRQSINIAPGPFQLNNLPVVTGQGEVKLVMKDLLGREQILTQPYFASSSLLAPSLSEYSYEAGFVRNNYGTRSDDYGQAQTSIQWRHGINETLTSELRGELMREQQTAGLGASQSLGHVGLITAATALSRSAFGTGRTLLASYERPSQQGPNFSMRTQWTSAQFTQLGWQLGKPAPLRTIGANLGYSLASSGSLGVNFIRQDNRGSTSSQILSANYTLNLGSAGVLIASAFKSLTGDRSHSMSLIFSTSFGDRGSASASHTFQQNAPSTTFQAQESVPQGDGTGYRLLSGTDVAGNRTELGFSIQNRAGLFALDAAQNRSTTSYRLNATGGFGVIEGHPFLSRRLYDGFGLAHIPGFSEMGIFVNNELVGRTDSEGYAPLPWLIAYVPNQISLDASALPIDTQISQDRISITPFSRSGLLIDFPATRTKGALLVLTLQDGSPVPSGTVVSRLGSSEEFKVAFRGEAYVTGIEKTNRLQATWRGQRCEFDANLPPGNSPIPRIGPIVCDINSP